jgi:hypothetical protein
MKRLLALSFAFLLPSLAGASPLTFALDHGSVTARLTVGSTVIGTAVGQLDSGFVVFDPTTGGLPDFSLGSSNLAILAPALPGAYNALDLAIQIDPAAGYSNSATGTGPWSITLGPIDISFSGTAFDNAPPITVPPIPVSGILPVNSFGVTAFFNAGQMRLGLLGLKVGEFTVAGVVYEVRADIEFVGFAVPEPALASLALVAIAGLAWIARRR